MNLPPSASLAVVCGTVCALLLASAPVARAEEPALAGELRLQPAALTLSHPRQPHSVLVSGTTTDGRTIDLTRTTTFASADHSIAAFDAFGWVRPVASGRTTIRVEAGGKS